MVLAGRQREHVRAVAHHDEACFLAFKALFDHHARAGLTQALVAQHPVHGRSGFLDGGCDDHALAGGEAVGLYHDGRSLLLDILAGFLRIVEGCMARGGDRVPHHELLGEILGGFKLRSGPGRAEYPEALCAELIDDAGGKRRFGTDHGQVHAFARGEVGQGPDIGQRNVLQAGLGGRAPVAGRDEHLSHPRAPGELPREGMLASSRPHDEQLHVSA